MLDEMDIKTCEVIALSDVRSRLLGNTIQQK
jgi:hypothetical protein